MTSSTIWMRYFHPAFAFMSVVIGGGYATGRELAQYFMPAGPVGGLLGMVTTAVIWSVVFGLSLELARLTRSFEYRSFFQQLLGPAWFLFELAYLALLLLVLAVLGAASGEIVGRMFTAPRMLGTIAFILLIAVLTWRGSQAIERFLSIWGVLLFALYGIFVACCVLVFGDDIEHALASPVATPSSWIAGGILYAGYNLAAVPALLFCARRLTSRRETLVAGALAGPVGMLPGLLLFIAMLARYPEIMQAPIPLQVLLDALNEPWLATLLQIAIFGTFVQTGIGVLHGFNERVRAHSVRVGPAREHLIRLSISVGLCVVAIFLAGRIGLIDLVAKGYGSGAWLILAIYIVPLLTVGLWRIWRSPLP